MPTLTLGTLSCCGRYKRLSFIFSDDHFFMYSFLFCMANGDDRKKDDIAMLSHSRQSVGSDLEEERDRKRASEWDAQWQAKTTHFQYQHMPHSVAPTPFMQYLVHTPPSNTPILVNHNFIHYSNRLCLSTRYTFRLVNNREIAVYN